VSKLVGDRGSKETSAMIGFRLAALMAVLAWPLHHARAHPGVGSAAPVLLDLRVLGELRSAFESDVDKIRIVLLLSPT
jgi:hypothetical protein